MLKGLFGNLKSITEGINSEEIDEHGHCCDFGDCEHTLDNIE